jgi:hypothetical protein
MKKNVVKFIDRILCMTRKRQAMYRCQSVKIKCISLLLNAMIKWNDFSLTIKKGRKVKTEIISLTFYWKKNHSD